MATADGTVLGTCHHDCPDSCGWEVTVEAGRAVRLRGNPEHPYSRGELCPKVNRLLDRVHDPDRILHPLVADGPKGSGRFRRVSWDEALALVAARIADASSRWGGESIARWSDAGNQSLLALSGLSDSFFHLLGASRQVDSICGGTAKEATALTLGTPKVTDPLEVRYSRYVVLWGTNTRLTNRHLWPFVEEARGNGAKVVVIDPVRTVTAEAADWFLQPRPGTDVAMMLSMMHVIVRDGLVDADYVERHTTGFDALAEHVRPWTPARAAAECGVDADDIETFACEYANTQPAMIRTLIGAEHRRAGAQFFRTAVLLPTLTGAWRHKGGGFARSAGSYASPFLRLPEPLAHRGGIVPRAISMNRMGRALCDERLDPPVKVLFVWNGNPVVSAPEAGLFRTGMMREDLFTVVSEQVMTDTARHADVIFPACTQIEQDDVVPAWGHLYLGWNHKAIEPLGESVPNTELWRRLARAVGFDDPQFAMSDEEMLADAVVGLDVDALRRDGFIRLPADADLPFADGFPGPGGRLALDDPRLEVAGLGRLPVYRAPSSPSGGRHRLSLMSPKTHQRFLNSSYSHSGLHSGPEGGPYCEMHTADATVRGIADGDLVEVHNDSGRLRMPARVGAGGRVQEGMVIVPFGWLAEHFGGAGSVNDLTSDEPADYGGGVAFYDTWVDVTRV
jgi:anaerobic selenocysteine-containing dehydrogenase